uniref:Uncharacterized protein n=1 Tax=Glossina brevipalpis TaxID=37001 RepID=A0A1A9WUB5_9MUSC
MNENDYNGEDNDDEDVLVNFMHTETNQPLLDLFYCLIKFENIAQLMIFLIIICTGYAVYAIASLPRFNSPTTDRDDVMNLKYDNMKLLECMAEQSELMAEI